MADAVALAARPALDPAALPAGRSGRAGDPPGVVVRDISPAGGAGVAARRDRLEGLHYAAKAAGLTLPEPGRWARGGGYEAIWVGPERWLILGPENTAAALHEALRGTASVTDQSDARVVLEVSGPHARDALAKGLLIDLHPRGFRAGQAAVAQAARVAVTLWQVDGGPTFRLAAARSYGGSLAEWLVGAAAEFGLLVA